MAGELEGCKSLSGLLSGLAQSAFHGHAGVTEELLHSQLYPEVPLEEFRPFLAKMRGILKSIASADMDFNQLEAFLTAQTKKQGGITCEQAAVISKFWKSHKSRIRESLLNQSRWDNGLRGLSWRVDVVCFNLSPTTNKLISVYDGSLSLTKKFAEYQICGGHGPVSMHVPHRQGDTKCPIPQKESEFLCLEFDEVKVKQVLKRLSEVEDSISTLMQAA